MKKRLLVPAIVLVVLSVGLWGCTRAGKGPVTVENFKPVTLKFSVMNPDDYFSTDSVYRIKEAVEKETDGKIRIDVYPGGQLGNYDTVIDEIMRGTIDMAFQSAIDKYDARVSAHALPYLCTKYEDLPVVYGRDGFLLKEFEKVYAETGVTFLGVFTEGFQGIGSTKEIRDPSMPEVNKSFVLRSPNIKMIADVFRLMNFGVVTLPYSEVLSGMQTGVIDGWVGGTPMLNYQLFRDVIKKYYNYMSYVEATHFIMNQRRFQSLPEEFQEIIRDAVMKECELSFTLGEEMDKVGLRLLAEAGIEPVTFNEEEMRRIVAVTRTPVIESMRGIMGNEFTDGLLKFLNDNNL